MEKSQLRAQARASWGMEQFGGSGCAAVGIVCFIVHHQPVIHEVEAVRLCLIGITDHLIDCKTGPARAKVRHLNQVTEQLEDWVTGTTELPPRIPQLGLFPFRWHGNGAHKSDPGFGRQRTEPTSTPFSLSVLPRSPHPLP